MADSQQPQAPRKTYTGSCHCGAVEFEVTHPDIETTGVSQCNCSICRRNGYRMIYIPAGDLKYTKGKDHLTSYQFGSKQGNHLFCPTCGTSTVGDLEGIIPGISHAVNIRTLHGIEPDKIQVSQYIDNKGGHRSD